MSISGKFMTVKIGAVVVPLNSEWSVDEDVKELDRTTGADLGFRNRDGGIQDLHANLKAYMDISTGQYAEVQAGTVISNLNLYRDINDASPAFVIPSCLSLKSNQSVIVDDKCTWTANVATKGSYTYNDPT
jgi:hypothetical protein